MADGTTINGIYAARIHRSNAPDVIEEAEDMLTHYKEALLTLAAATPDASGEDGLVGALFEIRREIGGMWGEIGDCHVQAFLARHIVEWPDDCVDDYDPAQEGGA